MGSTRGRLCPHVKRRIERRRREGKERGRGDPAASVLCDPICMFGSVPLSVSLKLSLLGCLTPYFTGFFPVALSRPSPFEFFPPSFNLQSFPPYFLSGLFRSSSQFAFTTSQYFFFPLFLSLSLYLFFFFGSLAVPLPCQAFAPLPCRLVVLRFVFFLFVLLSFCVSVLDVVSSAFSIFCLLTHVATLLARIPQTVGRMMFTKHTSFTSRLCHWTALL